VGEANRSEQLHSSLPPRLPSKAAQHHRDLYILENAYAADEVEGLKYEAQLLSSYAGQLIVGDRADILAEEQKDAA